MDLKLCNALWVQEGGDGGQDGTHGGGQRGGHGGHDGGHVVKVVISHNRLPRTSLLWNVDMGGEGRCGSGDEEEEIPSSARKLSQIIFGMNILRQYS